MNRTVKRRAIGSAQTSNYAQVRQRKKSAFHSSQTIVRAFMNQVVSWPQRPLGRPEEALDVDDSMLDDVSKAMHRPDSGRRFQRRSSVGQHLQELRRRLAYCLVALLIGGTIGYVLREQIISWLVRPLHKQLYYTNPTGGLDFLIKICLFFGFLIAVPVIVYNLIRFIAPAVPRGVVDNTWKVLLAALLLTFLGIAFAYFVTLPAALNFLNNFSNGQVESLITAQEYFSFAMIYLAGFAFLFQMPLIMYFLNLVTPMKTANLFRKQRVVILVSFVLAAILTPTPDPINQTLMAVPIIVLYQISIWVVWRANKRRARNRRIAI